METHCITGQATDDSVAHSDCMLGTKATNTLTEYVSNTYCFFTAAVVARTRPLLRYTYTVLSFSTSLHSSGF